MMEGNLQKLGNRLNVSVDWLSFTLTLVTDIDEVLDMLGYNRMDFDNMAHGGKGYKSMVKLSGYPIYIMFDGNPDMGIHVDVSGSAVSELIRSFATTLKVSTPFESYAYDMDFDSTFLMELLRRVRCCGQVTRIDLAVDDIGSRYFTTDDMVELYFNHQVVSKFRNLKNVVESEISGQKTGHTLYFGSRKSDIFLRIYDKKLEQNKKLSGAGMALIDYSWVRWELELKGERAVSVCDMLLSGKPVGEITIGLLNNYVRIINLDNNNRSRCTTYDLWLDFIAGISPLRLYVPRDNKTIDDKKRWVKNQVMPTLAAIIISDGGSLEFVSDNMDSAVMRMKRPLREMISKSMEGVEHIENIGDFGRVFD